TGFAAPKHLRRTPPRFGDREDVGVRINCNDGSRPTTYRPRLTKTNARLEDRTMAVKSLGNARLKRGLMAALGLVFALSSSAVAGPDDCNRAPGLRYPLIDWRSVNGGALPQTFTYGMKEDAFAVTIEAGTLQNVGPDEMIVILESAGSWMWRKEIWSFNSFTGLDLAATIIRTDVGSPCPVSMRLTRAECGSSRGTNTIVFWKIDALGLFTRDMYHLDIDHFWSTLGGTIVTF